MNSLQSAKSINQKKFQILFTNPNQMFRQYPDQNRQPENGLRIADLEEAITEEQLFVEFRKYGQISFVKLHRYPFLGKSKGYAFMYFSSPEEAKKAKEAMNYKQLLRQPMRITYIQEYDKDGNLFFAGFEQTASLKELEEFFQKWGQVVSVKLSTDENKKSRGYGWVQYERKEQADAAITESLQNEGKLIYNGNQNILIKKFVKKGTTEREDRRSNLYVKNFWSPLDQNDLENAQVREQLESEMRAKLLEWFQGFGPIVSVLVRIDQERRAPFAFVSFSRHQDAKEAQKSLSQKSDPFKTGRMMYVGWAQTKSDRKQQRDNNLFAKYIYADQLARTVTEDNIRTTLKDAGYGDIQLVRLEKMQQGFQNIIRIGYIVFEQAADANKLVKTFKENEKFEEIKKLFEVGPDSVNAKYFQHLFPQQSQQRGQRRNNPRQSPNRRMYPIPQQFPPGRMQFPGPFPPQPGMRRPPYPPQKQGPGPVQQLIRPVQQDQSAPAPIVNVAYNQRQDYIELMNELEQFNQKPENDQRAQLQIMLLYRIKAKLNTDTEAHWKKISEVLSDQSNYSVEEILEMIKDESLFNEYVDEAVEQLKGSDMW